LPKLLIKCKEVLGNESVFDKKDGAYQSKSLMSNIINLTKAEITDINDIFEWRNHPDIRKNFFDSEVITWNDHEKWFNEKLKDQDTTIYVAYHIENKIGSIRFEANEYVIKISVMLNPLFLGKGLGLQVVKMGVEKYIREGTPDKSLIAEVKKNNIASIKTFRKAGFKENDLTFTYDINR